MEHIEEGTQTSGSSVPAAKRGQRLTRRRHHKLFDGVQASPAPLPRGERESARGTPRIQKIRVRRRRSAQDNIMFEKLSSVLLCKAFGPP